MVDVSRDFSAFVEQMVAEAETIAKEALVHAAKKTRLELYKGALKKGLREGYYDKYSPSRYKRSHSLKRAISPYYSDNSKGKNFSVEVGVEYDSSKLKGAYRSNSKLHQSGGEWISRNDENFNWSGSNGIPDSNWIMENFMLGVHPRSYPAETLDGRRRYEYRPKKTGVTQESIMKKLLDEQAEKVSEYISDAIVSAILGRL